MKARLATACLLLGLAVSSPAHAGDPDPWIANDKLLHFGVSAGIAGGSYAASATVFEARGHALLAAAGFTLAVGAGKELLDLAGWGTPSWKDFVADVAGTVVGLALAWSVDLLVRGAGDRHPLFAAPHEDGGAARIASPLAVSF